jgi:hypothetical protein
MVSGEVVMEEPRIVYCAVCDGPLPIDDLGGSPNLQPQICHRCRAKAEWQNKQTAKPTEPIESKPRNRAAKIP